QRAAGGHVPGGVPRHASVLARGPGRPVRARPLKEVDSYRVSRAVEGFGKPPPGSVLGHKSQLVLLRKKSSLLKQCPLPCGNAVNDIVVVITKMSRPVSGNNDKVVGTGQNGLQSF